MADAGSASNQSSCSLAEFVRKDYEKKRENRKPIQDKWNDNYYAMMGLAEGRWKIGEGKKGRSKTFINVTKQKVMTAFAIIVDLIMSGGKIPFALKRSPEDEEMHENDPANMEDARKGMEVMKARIDTQLAETKSDRAFAMNILSMCIYGETIAKGRREKIVRKRWVRAEPDLGFDTSRLPQRSVGFTRVIEEHVSPGCGYAPLWDIFRDLEHDQPRDGNGVIHRQFVSPYWLRGRKNLPMFVKENIEKVLAAQTQKTDSEQSSIAEEDINSMAPGLRKLKYRDGVIRYLERVGRVPSKVAEEFETALKLEYPDYEIEQIGETATDEPGDEVYVMACEANGFIVRYARITVDEIKYWRGVCEQVLDDIASIGVADNVAHMQTVINGAFRAFEDNKKQSGNVQRFVKAQFLEKPSQLKENDIGQDIQVSDDCPDARMAVSHIVTPDVGETLLSVIDIALKMSDNDSMIPRVTQGVEPEDKNTTAFQIAKQLAQSGKYIGSIIRNADEGLIEPQIEDILDYNMEDPDLEDGKGDYIVQALGFSSYSDKVERINRIQQFLALILSDEELRSEAKLRAFLEDSAQALDVDQDRYLKSEEDKRIEAENKAAMGPDPLVAAQLQEIQANVQKMSAETQATLKKVELQQVQMIADIEQKKKETAALVKATPTLSSGKVSVNI